MKDLTELIDTDESVLNYKIQETCEETQEENLFELGDIEIDTEIEDMFSIDDDKVEYINSVNMDGIVENIEYNVYQDRKYLSINIKNSRDNTYFKITLLEENALKYKDDFKEGQYVMFFNLVLTFRKNRKNTKDKTKYPRLLFDEQNGSYIKW